MTELSLEVISDEPLFAVDLAPGEDLVAAAGADGVVLVCSVSEKWAEEVTTIDAFASWVNDVRFSHKGEHPLAGSSTREIHVWPVKGAQVSATTVHALHLPNSVIRLREGGSGGVALPRHRQRVVSLVFLSATPAGPWRPRWALAGNRDGEVIIWDLEDLSRPRAIASAGKGARVIEFGPEEPRAGDAFDFAEEAVQVDAGLNRVSASHDDESVTLVSREDVATPVARIETEGIPWEAKFAQGDDLLFVTGTDEKVHIMDLADPTDPVTTQTLVGPRSAINATDVTADGSRVAAAVMDGTTWVWRRVGEEWKTEVAATMPTSQILAVGWRPDGEVLATGGGDGFAACWPVRPDFHAALLVTWQRPRSKAALVAVGAGFALQGQLGGQQRLLQVCDEVLWGLKAD